MATSDRDPHRLGMRQPDARDGGQDPDKESHEVDAALRRLLEPNPFTVERLVRTALQDTERTAPHRPGRWAWWPGMVAAAALLVLLLVRLPRPDVGAPMIDAVSSTAEAAEGVRVSISNEEGFVTISTASGSKWILYSGDNS